MPDLRSVVDRIHYENRRAYTDVRGGVAYLDGAPLKRPLDMPRAQRVIALFILAVGVVIGAMLVNDLVVSRWRASADAERAVAENLARPGAVESLPDVAGLMRLDNDGVRAAFAEAGYAVYDASAMDDSHDMVLYKVPGDMSVEDAAVLFLQGVGSLDAGRASRLLNGSWYFAADRANGTSMVVRYADFTAGDPEVAVHDAISREGFDVAGISESGVDESGNTYSMGTVDVDGTACTWKVSALPLDEVYPVPGLPEDACYVGVRVTAA